MHPRFLHICTPSRTLAQDRKTKPGDVAGKPEGFTARAQFEAWKRYASALRQAIQHRAGLSQTLQNALVILSEAKDLCLSLGPRFLAMLGMTSPLTHYV